MLSLTRFRSLSVETKRLFSNFLSLGVMQGANFILPLLTLPYLVRVLGAEKFGLLAFATTTVNYFVILTDFGFNLSATREISVHRDDHNKITEIFNSVMQVKFVLMLVSFVFLSVLVFSFDKFRQDSIVYFLTFGTVVGQVFFPVWFFQGMERMKYITCLNILSKLIFTIAIFVFVHKQEDYLFVPALTALGFIVAGVWSLTLIKRDFGVKFKLVSFSTARGYFMDSSQYFLSRVSVSIYTSSNAFVLGLFTNNTVVGYYAMAEKLYQALQGLYLPLVNAIYPFIAKGRNITLFKKIFSCAVIGNSILIASLFLTSGQLLGLVFGLDAGVMTEDVFRVLLVAALIVVPSILLGYPFLGALGKARHANLSVVYGSVFHFILLSLLVLFNQVEGFTVAVAVLLTESLVFIYRFYFSKELGLWAKPS